nr:glycosyltransferase [Nitrosomonas sp.]
RPEQMTPVPMGVDTEVLQNIDIQPADDPRLVGKRVLVYLGILEYARKIHILFEMLAIVKKQIPDILLVLVGDTYDDADRKWLKMKAEKAGVKDQLVWTGWLPMHEGWRYVRTAELGLSPIPRGSLLDCGSPTKVPEYLALGIPVVCNDNPDQEQAIKDSGAGICVPYSAQNFANAVIKMLSLDKAERDKMQIKGKNYVIHYRSYLKIGNDVANAYKRLLSTKESKPNDCRNVNEN